MDNLPLELEIYTQILVRWIHIISSIFWIGTTLYLGRMGRSITPSRSDRGVMGTVLSIHSGAVWCYVKLRKLPAGDEGRQKIYWFKWESLVSWLSGVILFVLVYQRGDIMQQWLQMGYGLLAILAAVAFYAFLWANIKPGSKWEPLGVLISYLAIAAFVYILGLFMYARAVWMHLAVAFGTIMAIWNVWCTILPSQRQILEVMEKGGVRNEELALWAFRCTKHNTYMMVPLVLMMMSHHYPGTLYGTDHDWIVISVSVLIGWAGAHLLRTKM